MRAREVHSRVGFTLIELLVVIAVIGILIGMLMPAVQQVREAARRTSCKNNIRQTTLAFHHYHTTHEAFPQGTNPQIRGPFVEILPFLEQQNLEDLYDFDEYYTSPGNLQAINRTLPVYLCPSMNLPRDVPNLDCNEAGGPTSYGGSMGTSPFANDGIFAGYSGFSSERRVRIGDIRDGTTHTILVGEWNYALEDYLWSDFSCLSIAGTTRWGGHRWAPGYPGVSLGATVGDFNVNLNANRYMWRSDHAGGANLGLCDGSVTFVANDIDANLLDAMATRSGGEVNSSFGD